MTNIYTTSLFFDGFSLDFDVDINASTNFTKRFSSHGPNFVFAVAEVLLNTYESRYLLIPSVRPANFIEMLKLDLRAFSEPTCIPNLEHMIPYGGWCSWIDGYWKRFNDDLSLPDDEEVYNELIKLELMSSKNGCAAIYKYNGIPTIEVATFGTGKIIPTHVLSKFSPSEKVQELTEKMNLITDVLLTHTNK